MRSTLIGCKCHAVVHRRAGCKKRSHVPHFHDVDGSFAPLGAALSLKRGGTDEDDVTERAARRGAEESTRMERSTLPERGRDTRTPGYVLKAFVRVIV